MEKSEVLKELKNLMGEIIDLHHATSEKWIIHANKMGIPIFNQKSNKVSDAGDEIMSAIMEYDTFLTTIVDITTLSERSKEGFIVNTRIKNQNSILDKKDDYCKYAVHKGKVSINKCFNDLFGIRAIIDCDELTFDHVKELCNLYDCLMIENKNFELIESQDNYIAIHIYIKGTGKSEIINKQFRWELQIWTKRQESNNQNQHERHRFRYRKWESGVKEDV